MITKIGIIICDRYRTWPVENVSLRCAIANSTNHVR